MRIEGFFLDVDELALGINMYYGEDENGQLHAVEIGLLIFKIVLTKYL